MEDLSKLCSQPSDAVQEEVTSTIENFNRNMSELGPDVSIKELLQAAIPDHYYDQDYVNGQLLPEIYEKGGAYAGTRLDKEDMRGRMNEVLGALPETLNQVTGDMRTEFCDPQTGLPKNAKKVPHDRMM